MKSVDIYIYSKQFKNESMYGWQSYVLTSIRANLWLYMHGSLDRTCQVRMKASNLVKFIQRHKDVGSF